jgi:hypothetical protein
MMGVLFEFRKMVSCLGEVANQITGAKVAGACCFMRLVLSRFPSSRSGAYRHFAQFYR